MTVLEDEIYAICWNLDQETLDNEMTDDGYINMGEYAVKIDRNTYNVENVGIDCVIGQCRYSDSQILYYAHDDGGYYFIIYNSSSDTWENKNIIMHLDISSVCQLTLRMDIFLQLIIMNQD